MKAEQLEEMDAPPAPVGLDPAFDEFALTPLSADLAPVPEWCHDQSAVEPEQALIADPVYNALESSLGDLPMDPLSLDELIDL